MVKVITVHSREDIYSNENILLEWYNILNRGNNNFDLSKTLFIEKLFNYYSYYYDKYKELNKLFRFDNTDIILLKSVAKVSTYKFARFKSELFECLPDLLSIIDHKIPVSLFIQDPNAEYTIKDSNKIYTPKGIFSRTKEYNEYFGFSTDINDLSRDLTPTTSLNQPASDVKNEDLKTIYYRYNDIYKTVLDTYKLYQKCLNSLHHNQVLNDFVINLRYNHTLYYNFDNINFKIDNYTVIYIIKYYQMM